jgi:hypothetical protein
MHYDNCIFSDDETKSQPPASDKNPSGSDSYYDVIPNRGSDGGDERSVFVNTPGPTTTRNWRKQDEYYVMYYDNQSGR